ncbi:hypothetical protein QJQ45_020949, partial [Haematococcus lacustris]
WLARRRQWRGSAPMGAAVSTCLLATHQLQLLKAVELGDVHTITEAVRRSPQVSFEPVFPGRNTLLHATSRYGQTSILIALIAVADELRTSWKPAGASRIRSSDWLKPFRCTSYETPTPLERQPSSPPTPASPSLSAQQPSPAESPATPSAPDDAAAGDGLPLTKALVNLVNAKGQSPLIIAASRGHVDVVQLLLDMGADPLCVDSVEGCTALHYAAMYGHALVAHMLLSSPAAQGDDTCTNRLVDVLSHNGAAALHYASDAGHHHLVKVLCDRVAAYPLRLHTPPPGG